MPARKKTRPNPPAIMKNTTLSSLKNAYCRVVIRKKKVTGAKLNSSTPVTDIAVRIREMFCPSVCLEPNSKLKKYSDGAQIINVTINRIGNFTKETTDWIGLCDA